MSNKNPDCNLVATLRNISFLFLKKKHMNDMLVDPHYRRNIELLQEKKYILIEDNLLVVTESGNELMKDCQ